MREALNWKNVSATSDIKPEFAIEDKEGLLTDVDFYWIDNKGLNSLKDLLKGAKKKIY